MLFYHIYNYCINTKLYINNFFQYLFCHIQNKNKIYNKQSIENEFLFQEEELEEIFIPEYTSNVYKENLIYLCDECNTTINYELFMFNDKHFCSKICRHYYSSKNLINLR